MLRAVHVGGRAARSALGAGGAVALLALLAASPSQAHDDGLPIDGESVLAQGPPSAGFSFASTDADLAPGHDPRQVPSWVLVRGEGVNGERTRLIPLDPTKWASEAGGRFVYDDPAGTRDGIQTLALGTGELSIAASGEGWSFVPGGGLDALWVYLRLENELYCARFPGEGAMSNGAGRFESGPASAALLAPEHCEACGNGKLEAGEECDDGNLVEEDGCTSACTIGSCGSAEFSSTFDAIQAVVFEGEFYGPLGADGSQGCSALGCHHPLTQQGNLDLSAGASYDQLLLEPATSSAMRRVAPQQPNQSFLYRKLQAKLDPELPETPLAKDGSEGIPMPFAPNPLDPNHLEAIRLWILGGAPRDTVVEGTQALLGACLPEPVPQKIAEPDPPQPDPITGEPTGFQLRQTPWPLYGRTPATQGEDEVCMATYYDVSALVPEWAKVPCEEPWVDTGMNPSNECFAWHGQVLRQDPQSHHSILTIYDGATGDPQATDRNGNPWWGPWSRKSDDPGDDCYPLKWPDRNDPPEQCRCDPRDPEQMDPERGYVPGCSGRIQSDVACLDFGPPDGRNFNLGGGGSNQLLLAQTGFYDFELSDGVFTQMPVRGIIHWNSHAFNTTSQHTTLAQYLNMYFARPEDQAYPSEQIFDARWIFAPFVEPYATVEVCGSHTLPQGARLFQLSSHTHQRGVRWRTWLPPNQPCRPPCLGHPITSEIFGCDQTRTCVSGPRAGEDCTGGFGSFDPVAFCGGPGLCRPLPVCEGPREDLPEYTSTEYNDPRNKLYPEPLAFDSPDPRDRTLLFCSEFDNGATPRAPVKRRSTSPDPPELNVFGLSLQPEVAQPLLGGPCTPVQWPWGVRCLEGEHAGEFCGLGVDGDGQPILDHAFCGDPALELCDACAAHGGITTEDEMFILLGNYFVVPEPAQILLGLGALCSAAALARRRRTG